jgi:hypothetical protein
MKRASLIFATIVLMLNVLILGAFTGFDRAYRLDDIFKVSALGIYVRVIFLHFGIAFLLLVFVVGKIIKKEILSQLVCFASLIPTLYLYWKLFQRKSLYLTDTTSYTELLRSSISLDWFGASVVLFLLAYQVTITLHNIPNKNYKMK